MDRNLRHRTPDRRPTRSADAPRQHPRDERRQLPARPKPRPKGRSSNLITRHRIGPMGQCAMARASYLGSTRAMALGTPPLAWFCAATWPVFAPPLTTSLLVSKQQRKLDLFDHRSRGAAKDDLPHARVLVGAHDHEVA